MLSLVSLKLAYLQIIRYGEIGARAVESWQRSLPIEASRGYIYDRNGNVIASSLPTMSIAIIPYQMNNVDYVASKLAIILNSDKDEVYNKINKRISIVRLSHMGRQISMEQASKIHDLNMDGVYLLQDSLRYYPHGSLLAHTLGFVGIDNQGLSGLELYYEEYLKGKNGSLNYILDAKGGLLDGYESEIEMPAAGMSITLTVDLTIQKIVERVLYNSFLKYTPESAYALAMNPKTGEILSIASYPTFNPNNYKDYDSSIYNHNLPIWANYEPGSTFKPMIFAAGLNEGLFDMYKDTYYDKGYVNVGGAIIKSWKKGGHGLQTYVEVLQNSSNPGMVSISDKLGNDKMYEYIKLFGFGQKTGIDLIGESSGIMFKKDNYGIVEQATTSFGQGLSVTMIQLASAFSSLINGGYLMKPYITKSINYTGTNEIIVENKPIQVRQVISNKTSDLMRDALARVVALGGGRTFYVDGYNVMGKTGTAQKVDSNTGAYKNGEYILSVISAAPYENPSIVLYVALDAPKSTIQYGGPTVGPLVKEMLSEILPYMGVKKTKNMYDRTYTWMDIKTTSVPNYIGLEKSKVRSSVLNFEFVGDGKVVIDQLPRYGEIVEEGSTIMILIGD